GGGLVAVRVAVGAACAAVGDRLAAEEPMAGSSPTSGAEDAAESAATDGLLAEYLFDRTGGESIPNTSPATDSAFGPAIVHEPSDADWTGTSLTLRGGPKDAGGNWVELPDDLLTGQESATVVTEVRASAEMLENFHYLWNIGSDSSATGYFFTSLNCGSGRSPLLGIKSDGDEHLVQSSSCTIDADQWLSVAAVLDGSTDTATLY